MKQNIKEVVEETRIQGKVAGVLNYTFISLIPKKDKIESYNGYNPISLCDLIYNIITDIISNKIKAKLAEVISIKTIWLSFQHIYSGCNWGHSGVFTYYYYKEIRCID